MLYNIYINQQQGAPTETESPPGTILLLLISPILPISHSHISSLPQAAVTAIMTTINYNGCKVMLPPPGDPLITSEGKVVKPVSVDVENGETGEASLFPPIAKFTAKRELRLIDTIESDPKTMTAIASVIGLRLMGFSETSIAELTGAPVYVIRELFEKQSTQQSFELIYKNIINRQAVGLHGRIASYADDAITTVVNLMSDAKAPHIVQLKAAQDILDRSGTNAEQVFADTGPSSGSDELNIVVMNEGEDGNRVEINIKR